MQPIIQITYSKDLIPQSYWIQSFNAIPENLEIILFKYSINLSKSLLTSYRNINPTIEDVR